MPDTQEPKGKIGTPEQAAAGKNCCRFCLGLEFKRSRMHAGDIFTLLRGRVPARCTRCGQLQTITLAAAKNALPAGSQKGFEATAPKLTEQIAAELAATANPTMSSNPQADARAAIPYKTLHDALDLRCQYCPGQQFRRSRLRLQDVALILRMQYSVRCLRCGQRQTANFMVAGSAIPSSVKQARSLRNTETWGQFTATTAPPVPTMESVTGRAAVIAHVYTLKDVEVGDAAPLLPMVTNATRVRTRAPEPEPVEAPVKPKPEPVKTEPLKSTEPMKRRSEDGAIW